MNTLAKVDKNYRLFTIVFLTFAIGALTTLSLISNAIAQENNNTSTSPTQGYDAHAVGMKHIYGSPDLEAHFYCKMNDNIMATCQIYDSNSPNASLIGVEYIISSEDFNSLPNEEKPNWYVINQSLVERADLRIPELSSEESQKALSGFLGTYGKLILTWNPIDTLPSSLPQVIDLHNRELVNPSSTNATGSLTASR
jgi:hypothetical protein